MTESRSFRLRSRRLGVWLVLLLVLANLPITVLALGSGLAVSEDRIAEGKRQIERIAALAASREAVLIAHLRGAVDAIDVGPALDNPRAVCGRVADALAVLQPSVRAVRIERDDGRTVLCTEARDGARVEPAAAPSTSAALTTQDGEVVVGTDTYTVSFAFRQGSTLAIELATATGVGALADLQLDRGQAVAILDRAGRIVTAAGDVAAFRGADALVATLESASQRFEVRMPNGQVMFAAAEAVPGAALTAIALAPLAMIQAAANRDLAIAVGLPLAFLVISVAVAWYGIDQLVVRWVDRLGRLATLYGAGRSSVRAGHFDGAPRELRTLADAFIILDEAQNTTIPQMKMFLTRFGMNSRMVVCGDPKQVDLPIPASSGLADAVSRLEGVEGINVSYFTSADVVRHPIVGRIVDAYEGPGA